MESWKEGEVRKSLMVTRKVAEEEVLYNWDWEANHMVEKKICFGHNEAYMCWLPSCLPDLLRQRSNDYLDRNRAGESGPSQQ